MTSTAKTDTMRSSNTVQVPVRVSFSFQKQKQDKPLQFIKEVKLLKQMEDRKELSTSTSMIEDPQENMMEKNPTRQSTKSVSSRSTMSLEIVGGEDYTQSKVDS